MQNNQTSNINIASIASIQMLEQCAALLTQVFNNPPWNDEWTQETAIAILTCYYHTSDFMGWVATLNNQVIGCAMGNTEPHYSGSIFYLRELFVVPNLQKMGLGKRLMATVKADLKLAGTPTVILFTRKALFNYYIKIGFSEIEDMGMMSYTTNNV